MERGDLGLIQANVADSQSHSVRLVSWRSR